ncbi:ABC transporter permease [Lutibacter sp. B2]|nr:ABC transporter permease [Lutibacter sp. B2]
MKTRTIIYSIKQGIKGSWRNRMMSIASITSIASVLMILGIVFMIVININSFSEITKGQFDTIQLDLEDDLSDGDMQNIGKSVKSIDGVKSVYFLSKEKALDNMKKKWGENGYLLEGLQKNPLPNSYVVELMDMRYADEVVKRVKGLQGLEEVRYYKDLVEKILKITDFIRLAGLIVIGVLILISMFVVANTIKLTVIARKKEIGIMKYVGATNWFIRCPFMIEGMILGVMGSAIAIGVISFGYKYVFDLITQKVYVMIAVYMVPAPVFIKSIAIIIAVLGIGIGVLGSIISMRKFLRV